MSAIARIDAQYIATLEAENERLREENLQLREERAHAWANGMAVRTAALFCLTAREGELFNLLMTRDLMTKESALLAMYSGRADDAPDLKIVDVYLCKIRGKLKPYQIEITTHWARGYSMTAAMKARVHALVDAPAGTNITGESVHA